MRAMTFGLCAAALLFTYPLPAAASPATDNATSIEVETLSDHDRWQGRQHYLYDEEHPPSVETTGSAASDARACSNEPVRLKRSDGSTVVRRFKRCD